MDEAKKQMRSHVVGSVAEGGCHGVNPKSKAPVDLQGAREVNADEEMCNDGEESNDKGN